MCSLSLSLSILCFLCGASPNKRPHVDGYSTLVARYAQRFRFCPELNILPSTLVSVSSALRQTREATLEMSPWFRYLVRFSVHLFSTQLSRVRLRFCCLRKCAVEMRWRTNCIIVCGGDDFEALSMPVAKPIGVDKLGLQRFFPKCAWFARLNLWHGRPSSQAGQREDRNANSN